MGGLGRKQRVWFYFYLFLKNYLFLAALGLRCCARAFSSCGERRPLLAVVHRPPTAVSFPAVEHRLQSAGSVAVAHGLSSCGSRALERRLSNCGTWAQLLCSMWDLLGPGLEPVFPALAGGLPTTVPPGKPRVWF